MQTLVPRCTSPTDAPRFPTATRRVHLSQPVNVRGQRTSQPGLDWDGTWVNVVSPADADPSLFVVIELRGCSQIRFGGPKR